MRVITKSEFLDYYEADRLEDIISTPIAIVAKVIPIPTEPRAKPEVVVVNIP